MMKCYVIAQFSNISVRYFIDFGGAERLGKIHNYTSCVHRALSGHSTISIRMKM